ncbi:unnamed protein product [Pieris macdunnoughi]|uniref:Uncharacterized protein n=1 Tax=Pieris macdunnoughi TaxID=345717 RepID=A0A821LK68_9NEOP|nr:unnamed protein product [Pieris macdunnoughi]
MRPNLSKPPSKRQRVTNSSQIHQSPSVSNSPSEYESVTDSSQSASTPEQQTNLRRSSRKRKKVEYRSVNLSTTPERPSTSRQSRQKKVSRRTVNTRTIGTQTVDYWFSMLMYDYREYDIIPRQQAQ